MKYLQRLGKSLMLPVACLPVAGILLGIGFWIQSLLPADAARWLIAVVNFLLQAGGAIINNIPILFAIGVSVGMSSDQNGTSVLSGLVSWLVITTLLSPTAVGLLTGAVPDGVFEKTRNAFIAILSGILGAWSYDHSKTPICPTRCRSLAGNARWPSSRRESAVW